MSNENERIEILKMIENGQISASQGLELLRALQDVEDEPEAEDPLASISGGEGSAGSGAAWEAEGESPARFTGFSPSEPPALETAAKPSGGAEVFQEEPSLFTPPVGEPVEEPQEAYRPEPESGQVMPDAPDFPAASKWAHWWKIPLWIGVGITIIGGLLMYWAWQATGFGFWFACTWFPFLIGVAVVALAYSTSRMRWLHVRVHQKTGGRPRTIAISLPLPLHLSAWAVRTFGHRIPHIQDKGIDQMILALENVTPDAPFYVHVNEDEDGESVEVFIG